MPTFGVNRNDGTIALCKAKPQNRGKGNCFHSDHVEREGEDANFEAVRKYNEERLEEHFRGNLFSFRHHSPRFREDVQGPGGALTHEEFSEATEGLSSQFTQNDWELLQNFYSDVTLLTEQEVALEHDPSQLIERLQTYLHADDPVSERIRTFLGSEIDLNTFAVIIVHEVKAMSAAVKLKNSRRRDSVARVVGTACANDMTRKRYIASVLFFAGRCCYCRGVMNKKIGDPKQATGEHLTPISPDNPTDPRGVTRFGNMALACLECNSSRKNQKLETWMAETNLVPENEKQHALAQIEAFRRFALYEEYNEEKKNAITATIEKIREQELALPRYEGDDAFQAFESPAHNSFVQESKALLFDLNQKLND